MNGVSFVPIRIIRDNSYIGIVLFIRIIRDNSYIGVVLFLQK